MKKKLISLKEFLLVEKLVDFDELWSRETGSFVVGDQGLLTHEELNNNYIVNPANFEELFIERFAWRPAINVKGSYPPPIKIGCSFEIEFNHDAQLTYSYQARSRFDWRPSSQRTGVRCWRYDITSMYELIGVDID